MKKLFFVISMLLTGVVVFPQENYKSINKKDSAKFYPGGKFYPVEKFAQVSVNNRPKNIILMIGDGMGIAQISASLFANRGSMFLENFKYCGFSQTQSASDFITDSAAGGTALSCGKRTKNGYLAVDPENKKLTTIIEYAEKKGLHTGLVSTSAITHATPASFIAHQESRLSYENIALDFLKTDIDIFIGGGYNYFAKRSDNKNLIDSLIYKGYHVYLDLDSVSEEPYKKLACLTSPEHNGRIAKRKDMLPRATGIAIQNLNSDSTGFFLMVEGSQIDWGGHQNDTGYIVEEMLDFDQSIGKALKFAAANEETLIIVTADHETGGMALLDGNITKGSLLCGYASGNHTGVMVPVFAYGPGADNFTGIIKNTSIFDHIFDLLIAGE